ncbi:Coenzyme A biosynthesis bifunctional protein CoaBC [Thalassocella blandensis]|nr:Coenzyme A biosynthesis bifunctional protein CoaBC [Thalassocella blandensis]
MQALTNKQILLGVTGGIAAYKSADLIRRLQDAGASVRVVMTQAAQEFITPLTMQALSGHPVHTDLLDPAAEAGMGHIELARWADLVVIAPATANFLAKLVHAEGSDLLLTLCLATKAPLALAPAMNQGMWSNPGTQENLRQLRTRGCHILGPAAGSQACGDVGMGRMLDVPDIVTEVSSLFQPGSLQGQTVLITAGPTREAIDPVRYISNHSSGKMGYALAQAATEAGAKVILVSGPVNLSVPDRVRGIAVQSAQQMLDAVMAEITQADIFIATAAVADFRPRDVHDEKIKKRADEDELSLALIKNPDILASVTELKRQGKLNKPLFAVGFAAETQHLVDHAREKLHRKNVDMIVANNVAEGGIGFNSEDNAVSVLKASQPDDVTVLDTRSKSQLARDLVQVISQQIPC